MRRSPLLVSLLTVVALVATSLSAGRAQATENFPPAIQADLGLAAPPDCSICHVGVQARGTVVTAFGTAMRARGLVLRDEASLKQALLRMEGERVDSDGDGTPDIAQLREGRDPNGTGGGGNNDPEYGCSTARGGDATNDVALTLLVIAALVIMRDRRRSPRRPGRESRSQILQ
jgi:MYXO-CTERM domain-containing protein